MGRKGIGFGVFLIAVGIIFFMIQLGVLNESVFMVFFDHIELTITLILIVVGINMIFSKYPFVKTLTWLAFFVVMIAYGNYTQEAPKKSSDDSSNKTFVVERSAETEKGELKLKASALSLTLGATKTNLIDGETKNVGVEQEINYRNDNNLTVVDIKTNSKNLASNFFKELFSKGEISVDRKLDLNISKDVVWDLNMDLDAIESNIDLSDLKIKNLDIDGDAGSFKLTLGEKYKDTSVNINADAAEVNIFIPKDLGVSFKVKGSANSTDFYDINVDKKGEYYYSENYEEADNKIDLKVKINAGTLEINGI
jgi:predicted membrane protein